MKTLYNTIQKCVFLSLVLVSASCVEETVINLDEISTDIDMEYALSIPIGGGTATFNDMLEQIDSALSDDDLTEYIYFDNDGHVMIKLEHTDDNLDSPYNPEWSAGKTELTSFNLNSLSTLDSIAIKAPLFTKSTITRSFHESITFDISAIKESTNKESWPDGFKMDISFPLEKDGVYPQVVTGVDAIKSITFTNCWVHTAQNDITLNVTSDVNLTEEYSCVISIPSLNPTFIEGNSLNKTENKVHEVPYQLFDTLESVFDYSFATKGPKIEMTFTNPVGARLQIYADVYFIDEKTNIIADSLSTDTIYIDESEVIYNEKGHPIGLESTTYTNDESTFDFTSVTINGEKPFNSIVVKQSIIPIMPESGKVFTFTDTENSLIPFSANIEVPLEVQISKATVQDTIEFDINDIIEGNEDIAENIDSLNIYLALDNSIPIGMDMQLYLLDSNQVIIDSLFSGNLKLERPLVGDTDNEPTSSISKSTYSYDKYESWTTVKNLLIKVKACTSEYEEDAFIKIGKNDAINYNVSADVVGNYKN